MFQGYENSEKQIKGIPTEDNTCIKTVSPLEIPNSHNVSSNAAVGTS
jgi:hypothetical protein